jgi:hypothetical protein
MDPSIPPTVWARKKRRFARKHVIVLAVLPCLVLPLVLSSFADAYVHHDGVAMAVPWLRGMIAALATAEGFALLGLAIALCYWGFGHEDADAGDTNWELLSRATAMERTEHVDAALIAYERIAGANPHRTVGRAAQLQLDVLTQKIRTRPAGPRRDARDRVSAHLRFALSRPVVHP